MDRYVIIGNGIAGVTAAETIRSLDPEGSLTMIAAEEHLPYCRPMISMVLAGDVAPDRLPIRDGRYYQRMGIELLAGQRVVELDPDARVVKTDQGREVVYDRLLIAAGADPRPARGENSGLPGIFTMRTQDDVAGMVGSLDQVDHALVLGGGLVGFKAAYGLLKRGKKVTMLIRSGHPLAMQVDSEAGGIIREELEAHGLTVRVRVEAAAFEGNGRVRSAALDDGSALDCQLVVVAKGVTPAADFLPPGRIEVDYGIRVDQHLATSAAGVYAAGDVVEGADRLRGAPWVNAIWPVAVEHGRVAGANMAGRAVAYPGSMGRNVMRIFGLDVMAGGLVNPPADAEGFSVLFSRRGRDYRKLVMRGDRLVGAVLINRVEQGGVILSLINRQEPLAVDPEMLLEPSFNFATLLP